jgi:hypothetical protein
LSPIKYHTSLILPIILYGCRTWLVLEEFGN